MEQPPASRQELLRELNMTEEKARMILEAMRNSEIQYIQQQQRKPTKKPESGKPDW
jgi:Ca-activated chloride channel homolog